MTKHSGCPTETTLALIAGKWKVMVIYWLLKEKRRFNQLQRDLSGITPRTLGKQLKEMEQDGLLKRVDYGEIPPRVEYSLTSLGRSLEPILIAMEEWAQLNGEKIPARKKQRHLENSLEIKD
ncbi:helix-turn-helix domain-containing protein [Kiloniella laminariae]|uniref:Helix-turn-helix domain-containing protein n=1 Tax=Kiloniella laminariae TaxID=454162 RepID=A0ABT4LDJ1_9PROT|nr:helix-turn-helix domain-containing protein [Kiloniella laminariae]MCZ4279144.1 helix-turn-helix domain-containing protein [Kiloniella laminariae]